MKKLTLVMATIALWTILVSKVNAQENPVVFGIKGGVNLSTFNGGLKNTKSALRYQVGITTDIALSKNLYILTGLDLQTKGAKYNPKSASDVKYNPMYLQFPVNIAYKFHLNSDVRFVINAGPYVAYGIGGKAKSDGNKHSVFGSDKFKRLDYGVIGGIGVELGKFAVNAGYEYGLGNINDVKGTKIRNRNPFLTIGYKF